MDAIGPNGVNTFGAAVALVCVGFLAACSEASQEPAPVFALPALQVIGAPKIEGQEPEASTTQSSTRQLRYIAVPPGQKVAGMARAHLILKPAHHHPSHARKTKSVARHTAVRTGSGTRQPANADAASFDAAKPATSK